MAKLWPCEARAKVALADFGLIDSKLGLYIKVNVNHGQNKFEVHISKNVAKMAQNRPAPLWRARFAWP